MFLFYHRRPYFSTIYRNFFTYSKILGFYKENDFMLQMFTKKKCRRIRACSFNSSAIYKFLGITYNSALFRSIQRYVLFIASRLLFFIVFLHISDRNQNLLWFHIHSFCIFSVGYTALLSLNLHLLSLHRHHEL